MAAKKKTKFIEVKHQADPVFLKYYYVALAVCGAYLAYVFLAG